MFDYYDGFVEATRRLIIEINVEEESDQGLHCLPFRQYYLDTLFYSKTTFFRVITAMFPGARFF